MVGVTGSVGKTSVKDIARALLPGRVHANRENLNTEIGLPLTILEARRGDRDAGAGDGDARAAARSPSWRRSPSPRSAVITNVGPVHVELLGSVEAIAAAKAEVLEALPAGGTAVVPVEAGELEPHLGGGAAPAPLRPRRRRRGGREQCRRGGVTEALVATPAGRQRFHFPFAEAHNLTNALAAIAAGVALGAPLGGDGRRALRA